MKGYLKGLARGYITIGAATAVLGLVQRAGGQHTAFLIIGAGSLSLLAAVAVYLLAEIAENTTQPSWAAMEAERHPPRSGIIGDSFTHPVAKLLITEDREGSHSDNPSSRRNHASNGNLYTLAFPGSLDLKANRLR